MLYTTILVPFDGSEPAHQAVHVAKNLIGNERDATLYVLSVIPASTVAFEAESPSSSSVGAPMIFADSAAYERIIDHAKSQAEDQMEEQLGDTLDSMECKVITDVTIGSKVSHGIVDYAASHGVDMIVMGRRGLGALRGMLGSVSYGVLHEADVPVLTVK